jgi:hypothetical protein
MKPVWFVLGFSVPLLGAVDYATDIRPLLEKRCLGCHGTKVHMHGLRLDERAFAMQGGESGVPAIVAGDSARSLVYRYVAGLDKDVKMPPGQPLAAAEIATLKRWIDEGAVWPDQGPAVVDEKFRRGQTHWAFQKRRPVVMPEVRDKAWVRNPIDAFVLAKLEGKGWKPAPPATPLQLLRRVYLDLTGLPPTLLEQDAFLRQPTPERLDRVIDGLLDSPAYAERWARHWLDVVRYAESNGYERDGAKPQAWRFRDYVIRAFLHDKPFDRFLTEQIAGDELDDKTPETLIASGFHRLGPWDDEPADPATDRYDQLDDIVSTTSQAFLGLTMGCARCHNHKFEPLTAADYYSMVAIFNGLERPRKGRTELDLPLGADEKLGRGYFLQEPKPEPPVTHLLIRGKPGALGPEVAPAVPAILVRTQPEFLPPAATSRRRLSLARWMTSPENPLTARVIVNRIWMWHTGEGIVRTPSDFGLMGQRPTHPELLDWLANRFVEEGWSMKKLHRLILTSNTWRMSKAMNASYQEKDPEDRLLWRMPLKRLEVEAIRDSMLAASGRLNRKMYGPSVFPPIPPQALEGSSDPGKIWKASPEEEASRRTIYVFLKRSMIVPMLDVLDLCDTARSAAQRMTTSVPTQALTLFNSDFVNQQARYFAGRLMMEAGPKPADRIELAYRLALARKPAAKERDTMLSFLEKETAARQQDDSGNATLLALEQMTRVIFNLNEFVYAD